MRKNWGKTPFGIFNAITHLLFGWPVYLLFGKTGGPKYGNTNHFWPYGAGGKVDLFPKSWKRQVLLSDVGIAGMLGVLALWAKATSLKTVGLMYGLPYLVTNFWLVLYTWLQHTDVDVPHFDSKDWNYIKGAFHTIDRPYGKLLNFLHHNIGSTHVAHHVNPTIPHYHAKEVTEILKEKYPDLYLYDPTPIHEALWRVSTNCIGTKKMKDRDGMHVWQNV
jgi:omega-6 fatty acid desaturase (delta-12 desaturase)